jgi:hypothetical protein
MMERALTVDETNPENVVALNRKRLKYFTPQKASSVRQVYQQSVTSLTLSDRVSVAMILKFKV